MQLDLFDQPVREAKILAFPPTRMEALVLTAARRVLASGAKARGVLNHEAGLLQVYYWKIGLDLGEGARLADVFEQAVLAKVCEMRAGPRQQDPKGAA